MGVYSDSVTENFHVAATGSKLLRTGAQSVQNSRSWRIEADKCKRVITLLQKVEH